ncbi:DUF202 domain-containing protein [Micromonospora sp. HM5-17]|jgi:hypothetical protein|uniref:DUF202 domain-containing protein n=1 Tax=Micromonospora sp. HM5-17 TaxID=2487710 RepID=UPI000F492DA6|nr:DUF202 domain-containing protein [Micromonospora sp. HM5-17]ROT32494.1 DUF202 domain-containing protein [Micromonospora sp. HM5-17]
MTGRAADREGPVRDPGLARERTRLAWRRTVLAVSVVAVLATRLALTRGTAGTVLAALTGLGWLAVLVATFPRYAGSAPRSGPGASGAHRLALPLAALVSAGFAVLGVLLVLAPMR